MDAEEVRSCDAGHRFPSPAQIVRTLGSTKETSYVPTFVAATCGEPVTSVATGT